MPDAIASILAREGPLHRRMIHDRLVEMGVRIGGQSPVNNVGARLSHDPRFRRLGEGVWDLTESLVRDEATRLDDRAELNDTGDSLDVNYDQNDSDEADSVPW